MRISFVIPVRDERETLEPLIEGIMVHAQPHDPHIVLIDDGSTDGSFEVMKSLRDRFSSVQVIRLRGNFGKSAALAAGFAHADGDLVFTMDSDLQDDPQEIPKFIEKMNQGYDVVCGWKSVRHDPWHKVGPSRMYNAFVGRLFGLKLHDVNCGFKLFRGEVVKKLRVYGELHRLIPVMAHSLKFRVGEVAVLHHPRRYGKSKYGFERFTRGTLDVLTMWFLSRHRHAPGHFFGKLGVAQLMVGILALAGGIALGLAHRPALCAIACLAALVLGVASLLTLSIGLLAELILWHFVRIDPAHHTDGDETP